MAAAREMLRAPKGMLDVLAPESDRWIDLVGRFAERARRFGFGLVLTPMVEHYEVFQRVGEHTDVVRKEMYDFEDRGGRRLALRPEGTAPVVRAFVQHRPALPWKAWYVAPHFRAEPPPAGRYRQPGQLGVEALGVAAPELDVEVIALAAGFYRELGLTGVRLLVHSMGDAPSRARYREVLLEHLRAHADLLGADRDRAEANPLRILDSKRPDWQAMLDAAPRLGEYLGEESAAHFAAVQDGLGALGIDFEISDRLVRGFDYYTDTVFEFQSDALDAAQNAIGGGGRLDRLVEDMGGPPTPAIGFGIGIERLLLACDAEGVYPVAPQGPDVFVVDLVGAPGEVGLVLAELREQGLAADRAYGSRSPKKQLGAADRSGADLAVILGAAEAERGMVAVKDMRTGEQHEVRREVLAAWVRSRQEGTTR
ncbi:MAG: histidine--tRNA ligase [Actinomycetota bacterium]